MKRRYEMPFGAECRDDGSVRFHLWAPAASRVEMCLDGSNDTSNSISDTATELMRPGPGTVTIFKSTMHRRSPTQLPASNHRTCTAPAK